MRESAMKMRKYNLDTKIAMFIVTVGFLLLCSFVFNSDYLLRLTRDSPGTTQTLKRGPQEETLTSGQITCDRSHPNYDLCSINGPNSLDPTTATFFVVGTTSATSTPVVEKIRPYPRKAENFTMARINELKITTGPLGRHCQAEHDLPAVVFSAGGYTGNFFHDFNDGFVPLFVTINSVFPTRDVVLVVSKARDWWVYKYSDILAAFSKRKIIALENDTSIHCFTSARLGLISHGFMTIDPTRIPESKSFVDFRNFLETAFNHGSSLNPGPIPAYLSQPKTTTTTTKPRLVLISRSGDIGRVILNENEVRRTIESIGFEVIIFRPSHKVPLREAYKLINSSHAMVGVHGAGMTHLLFLRRGTVAVQVVPLGLRWVAKACFETPAKEMGLEYIEYEVDVEESSLIEKYGRDSMVIKDPIGFKGSDWSSKMSVYLKEQDVRLDLVRFRRYMSEVYDKAKAFMDNNG